MPDDLFPVRWAGRPGDSHVPRSYRRLERGPAQRPAPGRDQPWRRGPGRRHDRHRCRAITRPWRRSRGRVSGRRSAGRGSSLWSPRRPCVACSPSKRWTGWCPSTRHWRRPRRPRGHAGHPATPTTAVNAVTIAPRSTRRPRPARPPEPRPGSLRPCSGSSSTPSGTAWCWRLTTGRSPWSTGGARRCSATGGRS